MKYEEARTRHEKLEALTEDYISQEQLAKEPGERLRGRAFSKWTLMAWEQRGTGPPVTKICRQPYYHVASVERWLRSKENPALKPTR